MKELTLLKNDIIVVRVPVGNMPFHKMRTYLDEIRISFTTMFTNNQILILPTRTDESEITIVHQAI
jgi:hypothetical protein